MTDPDQNPFAPFKINFQEASIDGPLNFDVLACSEAYVSIAVTITVIIIWDLSQGNRKRLFSSLIFQANSSSCACSDCPVNCPENAYKTLHEDILMFGNIKNYSVYAAVGFFALGSLAFIGTLIIPKFSEKSPPEGKSYSNAIVKEMTIVS